MKEIWKDIPNYEGKYQISNLGRVKSILYVNGKTRKTKERILKNKNTGKYQHILLWDKGKCYNYTIHKLVAETFIPNPNNYSEINHKDENVNNNRVDNLEWCTRKYNINYGNRTIKAKNKLSVSIVQYDLQGSFVKEWNCMQDAIRVYNNYHICDVCKNKRKTASGFIWKYKEGD